MPGPTRKPQPRLVKWALASIAALTVGASACKDPNPTFVFDAAVDAPKDTNADGAGPGDASGRGGSGGGAGAAGAGGAGGSGGSGGGDGGGSGGAAGGGGTGQAGGGAGAGGAAGTGGAGGAA